MRLIEHDEIDELEGTEQVHDEREVRQHPDTDEGEADEVVVYEQLIRDEHEVMVERLLEHEVQGDRLVIMVHEDELVLDDDEHEVTPMLVEMVEVQHTAPMVQTLEQVLVLEVVLDDLSELLEVA